VAREMKMSNATVFYPIETLFSVALGAQGVTKSFSVALTASGGTPPGAWLRRVGDLDE